MRRPTFRIRRASGARPSRWQGAGLVCRWLLGVSAAGLVAGCASSGGSGSALTAAPHATQAAASCVGLTSAQALEAARTVFDATMLAGPTKLLGSRRVLSSPARVRVTRYLKGHGPRTVQVQTAVTPSANGVTVNADGIQPQAGQHWRIYSDRSRQPFSTSICAGSRPLKTPRRALRRFTGGGVTFAYPATWHAHRYQVNSSFSTAIVYLSPQRMHAPCVTHHGTHNTTIICHQPVTRLRPGSILAFWSLNSMPGWRPQDAMGAPLRVGGRPAKLRATHDTCGIGAQQTLDAVIPIPGSGNSFDEFIACIRGPHTATKAHQVHDLLNSVRFDH